MTPAAFIKEMVSGGRQPFYLLHGTEPAALGRCLTATEEAVDPAFRDFNHQVLELEAGQARRLIAEAATGAFMTPPRVVVAKNPPFGADDWNILADYLGRPNPANTIVLAMDKIDARLKFFKKIKAAEAEVDCSAPKGAGLLKWLAGEFETRGVKVPPQVCALIVERAGSEPTTLMGEVEKLSLYLGGNGGQLTGELVKRLVSLAPNANIFELGEALGKRDSRGALRILGDLLSVEHHLPILAMMVRHFRLMLLIKTRQATLGVGWLDKGEAASLGLHPFVLEKTQGQAGAWGWRELQGALAALEETHRTVVTSALPPQTVLENLALTLTRAPGG